MHADAADDAHEIRHRRALELRPWWLPILFVVNVRHDHVVTRIDVIPKAARGVIDILLDDLVIPARCVQTFAASGKLGDPDELTTFEEIGSLFTQTDLDRRFPGNAFPIPVRNVINWGGGYDRLVPVDAAKVLGLAVSQPRIVLTASRENSKCADRKKLKKPG